MAINKIFLQWELGFADNPDTTPAIYYPAQVPGAVQLDMAQALHYEPFYTSDNFHDYDWMEDKFWFYRTHFVTPPLKEDEELWLIAKGIDYQFTIFINREKVWQQTGMYQPVNLKVNKLQQKNEILIIIHPVPKVEGVPANRRQAAQSTKPAVSYGWDFHPRLIPLGICDDIYLHVKKTSHLKEVKINYQLSETLDQVTVALEIAGEDITGFQIKWRLQDAEEKLVAEDHVIAGEDTMTINFSIAAPFLWWPHDHGVPYLYNLTVSLETFDRNPLER